MNLLLLNCCIPLFDILSIIIIKFKLHKLSKQFKELY